MSNGELLYVRGMNLSETDADEADEDIWDDRKLNDAYDKAVKMASAAVAQRIAMSTNTQKLNKEGQTKMKNDVTFNSISTKTTKVSSKMQPQTWQAGMTCRAIYDEDGIEYEAIILEILNNSECVVKFLGYNNSEIVALRTLKPSSGKEERTRQIERACLEKDDEADVLSQNEAMECGSDRIQGPEIPEMKTQKRKKSKKKNKTHRQINGFELPDMPFQLPNLSGIRNLGLEAPLPPPPPAPLLSGDRTDEDQAISSMLLSWYMSGYYTGLYQGMKRAKESRRNTENI